MKFLKQLAENIINSFLFELELFLTKTVKPLLIFAPDYLLKLLIILKSEYPLIYEILDNIPIEIDKKFQPFLKSLNAPPLRDLASFNEYFIVVVAGFGFGVYNSYFIDSKITKKFSLGFQRKIEKFEKNEKNEENAKNEEIINKYKEIIDKKDKTEEIIDKIKEFPEKKTIVYHKEAFFLYETANFLLENLKFFCKMNFKENFSSGICLFNQTNFLLNLLERLKTYSFFSCFYEIFLKKSIETLCLLIKNATRDELLVLQALEIDAKIGVLYKEHMRYLYDKRSKEMNINKKMKAQDTKFFFQKHLAELIEEPEIWKEKAIRKKNKKEDEVIEEVTLGAKYDILKEIQEYGNLFDFCEFFFITKKRQRNPVQFLLRVHSPRFLQQPELLYGPPRLNLHFPPP